MELKAALTTAPEEAAHEGHAMEALVLEPVCDSCREALVLEKESCRCSVLEDLVLEKEAAEGARDAAVQELAMLADWVDHALREAKLKGLAEKEIVQTELEEQLAGAHGEGEREEAGARGEREEELREAVEASEAMQLEAQGACEALGQEPRRLEPEGEALRSAQRGCSDAKLAALETMAQEVSSKVSGQLLEGQREAIQVAQGGDSEGG